MQSKLTFFQRVKVLNPSRKYLSTTLITSMSTVIHQILKKKINETYKVLLTIDYWFNRQMPSSIDIIVHFI